MSNLSLADCGVWMTDGGDKSVARALAETAMRAAGLDVNDFKMRDRVLVALSPHIDRMLAPLLPAYEAAKASAK